MRVALDVTPLSIPLTGIGVMVSQLAASIEAHPTIDLAPFALTGRNSSTVANRLPAGVTLPRPIPAGLIHPLWRRFDWPTAQLLAGKRVDIVHGTNFYGIPGASAELITVHDTGPWVRPQEMAPAVRAFPSLVERAIDRGAHIHALSFAAGLEIRQILRLPVDRVHPIQIGFDPPSESPVRPEQLPDAAADRFVLAVGTIEPRKRLPQMVKTLAPILRSDPDLHLVIAGDGPDRELLAKAILEVGLEAQVHLAGYVSPEEKSWLLHNAQVVVSNSLSEGFGMVPLEAMSVGTPTVSTDGEVQREICGDASLLVGVDDPDGMRNAVLEALNDTTRRSQLSAAGRIQARRFSWDRTTEDLMTLYRRLVN